MLGQSLRIIVGVRKLMEKDKNLDNFSWPLFFISLLIGFVSGCITLIGSSSLIGPLTINISTVLGYIAAGYAGTDFIEGFMKSSLKEKFNINS